MVSAVFDGSPLAQEMVNWCKRITRGNRSKVTAGPQVMVDVTFTTDESAMPKQINYVNLSGKDKDKAQSGIYELSGNTLRLCVSLPGTPRLGPAYLTRT